MGRFDNVKKNIKKKKQEIHFIYILFLSFILIVGYIIGSQYQKIKQNELHELNNVYSQKINNLNTIINNQNTQIKKQNHVLQSIPLGNPIENISIASSYGYRIHPITDSFTFHKGIDLNAKLNQKIFATANGVVVNARFSDTYGYYVKIKHSYHYHSLYAHLNFILVNVGDTIKKNDVIGLAGNTGLSTDNHLHYEIHKENEHLDPEKFIDVKY